MRTITVFNSVSLDGYIADAHGEMKFAQRDDPEWSAWTAENASAGGELLFGRVTYDLMVRWWPTPAAAKAMPVVAERMNSLAKIVFSRTLAEATWTNTQIIAADIEARVEDLKRQDGPDMVIMGSGSIVAQLTSAGLIDSYTIVVTPVVLGAGRTMFNGVEPNVTLDLVEARPFSNGNVVLTYGRGT